MKRTPHHFASPVEGGRPVRRRRRDHTTDTVANMRRCRGTPPFGRAGVLVVGQVGPLERGTDGRRPPPGGRAPSPLPPRTPRRRSTS